MRMEKQTGGIVLDVAGLAARLNAARVIVKNNLIYF
jgi:hypothetical protein